MLHVIEKKQSWFNIGFNPMNNGDLIIISVPPLTERRDLAKQAKRKPMKGARKNAQRHRQLSCHVGDDRLNTQN
jgi:ribosome recycling factor